MNARHRAVLILNGGLILVVALLSGFLSVLDAIGTAGRGWESVHITLMIAGVWLVATGAAAGVLVLAEREARGLVWSQVGASWALAAVLALRAVTGVSGFAPEGPLANWAAFFLNMIVTLGMFLTAFLTVSGASNALRGTRGSGAP
jgi:hypothetical protein